MLDSVLTVAIGRNGSEGLPLSNEKWSEFRNRVSKTLKGYGLVVANTLGGGIGSDGVNELESEESAVFVVINPKEVESLRVEVAKILPDYEQGSACFSFDSQHEPVFATENGYRA